MKTLKINPQVYDDLADIKSYIAEDSEQEAIKVIAKILGDIENLAQFPKIGTHLKNKVLCASKYRYIITYSYATVYYVEKDNVVIVTVLHLARDFSALQHFF